MRAGRLYGKLPLLEQYASDLYNPWRRARGHRIAGFGSAARDHGDDVQLDEQALIRIL